MYELDDRPGHNAALTATEALTLLAFGKRETWDEFVRWDVDFLQHWGVWPQVAEMLELLEARGGSEPFYPWRPVMSDDGERVQRYETEFAAPSRWVEGQSGPFKLGAPELARFIRTKHRRRLGRAISFADLATLLRAEWDAYRDRAHRWDKANTRLRNAILNSELTAWAVRADDPKQEHVALPPQVALRAFQFRGDQIEPDDYASAEDHNALLTRSRWIQVRFRFSEIEGLRAVDDALHALDLPDVDVPKSAEPPAFPDVGHVPVWAVMAWKAFRGWETPAHVARHRSFEGGTDRLPGETTPQYTARQDEHRRFDTAELELLRLLASGQVLALGRPCGRATSGARMREPESEFVPIPASTFLNEQLAFSGDGNLIQRLPKLEREFPDIGLRGSTVDPSFPIYLDVRVEAAGLQGVWRTTAPNSTRGAEHRLQEWLEGKMRAAPNDSPGKPVMTMQAKQAGYPTSGRGFDRAWLRAVDATGAKAWSGPGPKSKRVNRITN